MKEQGSSRREQLAGILANWSGASGPVQRGHWQICSDSTKRAKWNILISQTDCTHSPVQYERLAKSLLILTALASRAHGFCILKGAESVPMSEN